MPAAPIPPQQRERLAALARYDILDTPRESDFDDITRLIARICDVPFAVVNLIDDGRQWFKSEVGFGVRETPLRDSFCAHAILENELLVIPDATKDERFACNPLVTGDPKLRFYAGSLLKTDDGYPLGTLCVLDTRPRELDEHQLDALRVLSHQVMTLLELRRHVALETAIAAQLDQALRDREHMMAVVAHDLRSPLGVVSLTAEMLPTVAPKDLPASAKRLNRAATTMRRLVDDLLDVEAMNRGALKLEVRPVALRGLVDDLGQAFVMEARSRGIDLKVVVDTETQLTCDPGRVQQALGNLVANALKLTPTGGEIVVSADHGADNAVFVVRDSGFQGEDCEVHHKLLGTDIFNIEYVRDLAHIEQPRCALIALPIKLQGLDGAPARVIAIEGQDLPKLFEVTTA